MVGLLKNFWLKIIALIMGCFVWLHVATEKSYVHEIKLPVTAIDLMDSLTLVRQPIDSIEVEVSATGKKLLRHQWRGRGIRLLATQFGIGTHEMEITSFNATLAGLPTDITLEEIIFPRQVELIIDKRSYKNIPAFPDIDATADDGFAISRLSVIKPESVELSGPYSKLEKITALFTEKLKLESLRSNVTLKLPLSVPVGYGFRIVPDSVTIQIDVVPIKTRVYKNIPIVIFNAPPSLQSSTNPKYITIEITGPPADIDLLNRTALSASVDYNTISENGFTLIKIDCPSGFKVKESDADSARIETYNADIRN